MLTFYVAVHTACYFALQRFQPQLAVLAGGHNRDDRQVGGAEASRRLRGDRGQTTAEYALVLLGAAGIAVLFAAWAAKSGKIGKLLDAVIDQVIDKAK